jgi:phosphoribosylformimino-5-aminoimidazole carboxamide ribonucleotide (ProFAR) isomerase
MFRLSKTRSQVIDGLPEWSLVEITWRDAYDASNGWTEVSSYKPEDQVARTVGYLWKDCQEHYITLCGTMFDSELPKIETVGNVTHIPIAMIQSINRIEQRRKDERIQIHS